MEIIMETKECNFPKGLGFLIGVILFFTVNYFAPEFVDWLFYPLDMFLSWLGS